MFDRMKQAVDTLRERAGVPVRSAAEQAAVERAARRLTFYHRPTCGYCLRVRIAMRRLDVPIATRDASDADVRAELIAGGGRATVPCLRIEDNGNVRWLYESGGIVRYLEDRFGTGD